MTTAKQTRAAAVAAEPVSTLTHPSEETAFLAELADALRDVRMGDLKVRLPRRSGLSGEVADAFNDVVSLQERQNLDVRRISRIVGRDGQLAERLDDEAYEATGPSGRVRSTR